MSYIAQPSVAPILSSVTTSSDSKYNALMFNDNVLEVVYDSNTESATTSQWDIQSPMEGLILDSNFVLEVPVRLVTTSGATTPANVTHSPVCPVSYPVNSAIQNISVYINNNSISLETYQIKRVYERLGTSDDINKKFFSGTACMLDNDVVLTEMEQRLFSNPHTRKRLLGNLSYESRYSSAIESDVPDNVAKTRTTVYRFYESIILPGLVERIAEEGLAHVNRLQIRINWLPVSSGTYANVGQNAMFKKVTALTGADILGGTAETANDAADTLAFTFPYTAGGKQKLHLRWVNPSMNVPKIQTIPYMNFNIKSVTDILPAGLSKTITHASTYTTFPDMIYIYCHRKLHLDYRELNSALRIQQLTLRFGDKPALFDASAYQLYQMSVRNGLDVSWQDWYYGGQCVVAIKLGKDIGGVIGGQTSNLSMEVRAVVVDNTNTVGNKEIELMVVNEEPGVINISPNNFGYKVGFIQAETMSSAQSGDVVTDKANPVTDSLSGKGLSWSKFKRGLSQVAPAVSAAARLGSEFAPSPTARLALNNVANTADTVNRIANKGGMMQRMY